MTPEEVIAKGRDLTLELVTVGLESVDHNSAPSGIVNEDIETALKECSCENERLVLLEAMGYQLTKALGYFLNELANERGMTRADLWRSYTSALALMRADNETGES